MRIRSKFRDYYDSIQAHGQDESLVYVRETSDIVIPTAQVRQTTEERELQAFLADTVVKLPRVEARPHVSVYMGSLVADQGAVFFCGKVYPFHVVSIRPGPGDADPHEPRRVYSWDKEFDDLVTQPDGGRKSAGDWREVLARLTGSDHPAVNLKHRSPVVVRLPEQPSGPDFYPARTRPLRLVIDARLQDINFQKAVDPYTAFQEIEMYLGGVLGQSLDVPAPMTDQEKVASHGLDPVYGFRKLPGGKRR